MRSCLPCLGVLALGGLRTPGFLEFDRPLVSEITTSDPVVETETIRSRMVDAPVRGRAYSFAAPESGSCTIDLSSHFFDAYLVLREEDGRVIAEEEAPLRLTGRRARSA